MTFEAEVEALARYNAEVARGIVHTPEWDVKMAEVQRRYNESYQRVIVNGARRQGFWKMVLKALQRN